ncbi:MAG: hypothetical protein NC429_16395 [Lachnospiraceae bacterium]|nr:hypothetical protein [Lachnospiraceae bacterium]
MKRVVIGGFLAVVSSVWAIAIGAYVQFNLASDWSGSRFWSSASQLGVIVPLVISLIILALGIVIMCIEYFRKDR